MTKKYLNMMLVLIAILTTIGCGKDDPVIPNEEELITTLNYTLTPNGGGTAVTLGFKDLDGDGGDDPVITGGTLAANQSYVGSLVLLNEAESPSENITTEIAEEDEDHQFFFLSSASNINIAYDDADMDGNPIGLRTILTTGDAGSGTIRIVLRHEPDKSASGASEGEITNAGGETDIEVTLPFDVE